MGKTTTVQFPISSIYSHSLKFHFIVFLLALTPAGFDRILKVRALSELLVVSELDSRAHIHTSEGGGLDLPVLDRVAEEAHT